MPARLIVDNSVCEVTGLTPEQFDALRARMTCEETAFGYSRVTERHLPKLLQSSRTVLLKDRNGVFRPVMDKKLRMFRTIKAVKDALHARQPVVYKGYILKKQHMMSRRGSFPTGLLYIAEAFFRDIPHTVKDLRVRPAPTPGLFTLTLPFEPYPEQVEIAEACLKEERGIITAVTGFGKSIAAALIINKLQVRTLLVVPGLELKDQLTEDLVAFFGADKVGTLSDQKPIAVENVDALDTKQVLAGYDCVLIDEFHHSGAATYRNLNKKAWGKVYYRFGLTATPYRSRDAERLLLESVLSKIIYRVDYHTAVAKGYICPIEAFVFPLPVKEAKNPKSWPAVYSELIVENEYRNRLIAHLMKTLHEEGKSTLCLVKEIKHGEILQDLTGAGFAHGQAEDRKQLISWFSSGKLKPLIGTTGVIGEGVNTRAAEWGILACGGKSRNQFVQNCGRLFRRFGDKESGKLILFEDRGNKWLKEHYECQRRYLLEEFGVVPIELPIPDDFE